MGTFLNEVVKLNDISLETSDLDFLPLVTSRGLKVLKNADLIINYIYAALKVEKGQIFYDRTYGTTVNDYHFEQLDVLTKESLKENLLNELTTSIPLVNISSLTIREELNMDTKKPDVIVDIEFNFDQQLYKITHNLSTGYDLI